MRPPVPSVSNNVSRSYARCYLKNCDIIPAPGTNYTPYCSYILHSLTRCLGFPGLPTHTLCMNAILDKKILGKKMTRSHVKQTYNLGRENLGQKHTYSIYNVNQTQKVTIICHLICQYISCFPTIYCGLSATSETSDRSILCEYSG